MFFFDCKYFRVFSLMPMLLVIFHQDLSGQRVLSIDVKNEIKTIKIYEGQEVEYRLGGSKEWYRDEVTQFYIGDSTILFENSLVHLRDIAAIRFDNHLAIGISRTLITFGSAWLLYGAIAQATGRYQFDWGTLAIGGTAIAVGFLTKKVAGRKTFEARKNAVFRLLDLNFIEQSP
jgi:hypothetical protein